MTRYTAFIQDFSLALSTLAPAYCQSAAARFLVISDLHGANRLDLVRAILEAESAAGRDLSAVLVLGDLVNWLFRIQSALTRSAS